MWHIWIYRYIQCRQVQKCHFGTSIIIRHSVIYICLFRKHEWEKHGRCATEVRETGSEHLYFNKTLSLRMKYNIDEILSSAGIKPGEKYQLQDIKSALKQKLGSKPIILCGNVKKVHWISAMVICMDRKFQLFDCPEKRIAERAYFNTPLPPHDRCRAEVFYPMK